MVTIEYITLQPKQIKYGINTCAEEKMYKNRSHTHTHLTNLFLDQCP